MAALDAVDGSCSEDEMAKVFITGSSDGLGLMAGRLLAKQGHVVVLHARSEARAEGTRLALPQAEAVLVGDLSTLAAMRDVADQANGRGRFDAVIHNVGIGYREPRRVETVDGLSQLWAINVLAPYVLTARMHKPDRLVYLSSGMHTGGDPSLDDPQWSGRRWNGSQAYADTKLHDVLLAFGVARRRPDVLSNALTPGWVPTRMGGPGAPDDLDQAHLTQAWLAVSDDPEARVTGGYFYHQRLRDANPAARDPELQDRLLDYCRDLSGVAL
jgi:NAD(P)-dependent dehydrogenase (short-subunit alcohol dehydrogenase family)